MLRSLPAASSLGHQDKLRQSTFLENTLTTRHPESETKPTPKLSLTTPQCVSRAPGTVRVKSRQGTTTTKQGTGKQGVGGTAKLLSSVFGGGEKEEEKEKNEGSGSSSSRLYFNITGFPFPLSPFFERRTIRYELERGRIWTFEQPQGLGFSSVTTNIRMTVIKLKTGGLWVHSPIAPTQECISLLKELGAPVEHIVLPTFAYEHKVFVGPFSRKFPGAKVWTAPLQWSWPLNLPPQLLGIFPKGVLRDPLDTPPEKLPEWTDEIDYKVLSTPEVGIGPYVEVAFFHRGTRTLLVTDAVVLVPSNAPDVVPPQSLLASAGNGFLVRVLSGGEDVPSVDVIDSPEFRRLGWQRMALLILYLGPSTLLNPMPSFSQVSNKLIVSPIVKTLVFDKVPKQVLEWIDSICSDWNFTKIVPCHFSAPIKASPADLRSLFFGLLAEAAGVEAEEEEERKPSLFGFLKGPLGALRGPSGVPSFPEDDLRTLRNLDKTLVTLGAVKKTGT